MIPFIYQAGGIGLFRQPLVSPILPFSDIPNLQLHLDFTDQGQLYTGSFPSNNFSPVTASGQRVGFAKGRTATLRGWRQDHVDDSDNSLQPMYLANQTPSGKGALNFKYRIGAVNYVEAYTVSQLGGFTPPTWGNITTTTLSTIVAVVRVRSCLTSQETAWTNTALVADASGWAGLYVYSEDASNVRFVAMTYGTDAKVALSAPFPKNEWAIVSMQHSTATLRIRVNGGDWTTITNAAARGSAGSQVGIGNQGNGTVGDLTDFDVAHIAVTNSLASAYLLGGGEYWASEQTGILLNWMK